MICRMNAYGAAVLVLLSAIPADSRGQDFDSAAREATLVFEARVVARDSSTMRLAFGGVSRTVVRVGRVLRSPEGVIGLDGAYVTVVVRDTSNLAVGAHVVFLAVGTALGRSLVAEELFRVGVTTLDAVQTVANQIRAADSTNLDLAIRSRVRDSEKVILGLVESTTPVKLSDAIQLGRGEHVPDWVRARVRIISTYAGSPAAYATVFVASADEANDMWGTVRTGQRYILLLRPTASLPSRFRAGLEATGTYFVLDAADIRPASDSSRVLRLVR